MNYSALKSGTDIRGNATEIAGKKPDLTERAVYDLTVGFIRFLGAGKHVVAFGHDSRISAEPLKNAVQRALIDYGCDYYDCGLVSTPAMYMTTRFPATKCDGAIMLTASHHPFEKNGMKFFIERGGLNGKELDEVIVGADDLPKPTGGGKKLDADVLGLYENHLKERFYAMLGRGTPLDGMKIAVDAGNGSGGFFADLLKELGADVSASLYLDPDGRFPNHIPNPENSQVMRDFSEAVKASGSDLGVIFDTDADRAAVVTADGKEINRNRLIAVMSYIILEKYPGATIVTDSVTSCGLTDFILARSGVHLRYKRGYRNVIDKAIELEKQGISAPLAIETSGHGAVKENYYLDDGAYLAVLLISYATKLKRYGSTLADLILDLKEPEEEEEFRIGLNGDNWKDVGKEAINRLTEFGRQNYEVRGDDYEGVRAYNGKSWFMVRQSVHDPVLVLNFEGAVRGDVGRMKDKLYKFLYDIDGLEKSDIEKLKK